VPLQDPETPVAIQCPGGLVCARVAIENGKAGAVRFESVPADRLSGRPSAISSAAVADSSGHQRILRRVHAVERHNQPS
jgi:hypothetical protein